MEVAKRYIEIMPFGGIRHEVLQHVQTVVEGKFGVPTRVDPALHIPTATFDPARGQYNASMLLKEIRAHAASGAMKVLGIIDEDMFANDLNYVFGQAMLGGCCGIISLSRLREGTDAPGGRRLFFNRIEKEAVHELGHEFGLMHCPNPKCVMFFSNSLADTDRKSADFCAECGVPQL